MFLERKPDAILNIWSIFDVPSVFYLSNTLFNGIKLRLNKVLPLLLWFLAMTQLTLNVIKGEVILLCDNSLKKRKINKK